MPAFLPFPGYRHRVRSGQIRAGRLPALPAGPVRRNAGRGIPERRDPGPEMTGFPYLKRVRRENTAMRKKALIISAAVLTVLLLLIVGKFFLAPDRYLRQIYLVPRDAVFVIETDEPVNNWRSFSGSEIWQFMKGYAAFSDISAGAGALDTLLDDNRR